MKLEQSFEVEAPLEQVWGALIDVERVAPNLPGAAVTGRNDDGTYSGTFTIKIGPTTASYTGKLEMQDIDEASHSATMHAQGSDRRGQGGATATISSRLTPIDDRTRVEVVTDYHITGRLARFGRGGMIEDISERLLREFASRLQSSLAGGPPTVEHAMPGGGEESAAAEAGGADEASEQPTAETLRATWPEAAAEAVPPPTEAVATPSAEEGSTPSEEGSTPSAEEPGQAATPSDEPGPAATPAGGQESAATPDPPTAVFPPTGGPADAPSSESTEERWPPPRVVEEPPGVEAPGLEEAPSPGLHAAPPPEAAPPPAPTPPAAAPPPPPHAATPPPPRAATPPPPPPPAGDSAPPMQGLSLVGGVLLNRIKKNPAPVIGVVGGLLLLRILLRRR